MLDVRVSLINAQIYPFICNFVPKDAQRLHGGDHNYFSAFAYVQHFVIILMIQYVVNPAKQKMATLFRTIEFPVAILLLCHQTLFGAANSFDIYNAINSCNINSNIVALHVTGFFVLFYHWSDQITGN